MIETEIAGRVRYMCRPGGYERAVLVAKLGISDKTLKSWESGKTAPQGKNARRWRDISYRFTYCKQLKDFTQPGGKTI